MMSFTQAERGALNRMPTCWKVYALNNIAIYKRYSRITWKLKARVLFVFDGILLLLLADLTVARALYMVNVSVYSVC